MQGQRTMTMVFATAIAVSLAGCDGGSGADEQRTGEPTDSRGAGAEAVSSNLIDRLAARYPVLREEQAPEPRPSDDADPANVPARFGDRLPDRVLQTATGEATFYADSFEGRRTASGIPFRQNQMVAAHRGFPFGTILRVTNLQNDRSVNVRVVDRGPFGSAAARGAVLDLSRRAATELDFVSAGRARVRVEVLEWGRGIRAG